MAERTTLVTGATDGIGRQTALELARLGHTVLVHGRNRQKAERACAALAKEGADGARLAPVFGDLSVMDEVRALAEQVKRQPTLSVLVHNAGVFMQERVRTKDGFETTFAVNHLAPFLLTRLLEPLVVASAPARVVTVASMAHQRGALDFADLKAEVTGAEGGASGYSGYAAYARSKLCNILFAFELAERLKGRGVTSNALHPGVIGTKLLREGFGSFGGGSVEEGAATSVFLAHASEVEGVTGKYFVAKREAPCNPVAHDAEARQKLWQLSEQLLGL